MSLLDCFMNWCISIIIWSIWYVCQSDQDFDNFCVPIMGCPKNYTRHPSQYTRLKRLSVKGAKILTISTSLSANTCSLSNLHILSSFFLKFFWTLWSVISVKGAKILTISTSLSANIHFLLHI